MARTSRVIFDLPKSVFTFQQTSPCADTGSHDGAIQKDFQCECTLMKLLVASHSLCSMEQNTSAVKPTIREGGGTDHGYWPAWFIEGHSLTPYCTPAFSFWNSHYLNVTHLSPTSLTFFPFISLSSCYIIRFHASPLCSNFSIKVFISVIMYFISKCSPPPPSCYIVLFLYPVFSIFSYLRLPLGVLTFVFLYWAITNI